MLHEIAQQPVLNTLWFLLVGFFWIGYVILDGFDLGVGMLMSRVFTRDERERRTLLNTIGPVWDGNEVWLITAGAATFAAFPLWYAALFSALYLPLTLLLLALILRAVAIEYRGKGPGLQWSRTWNGLQAGASAVISLLVGAGLALTTMGLPLDANGDRVGGAFAWLGWPVLLGGLGMLGYALAHGLAFTALKTDGELRHRARASLIRWAPALLTPAVVWFLVVQVRSGEALSWVLTLGALAAALIGWAAARSGREGLSFAGTAVFMGCGLLGIFAAVYPVVLPSTLDPAFDLTIVSAASAPYTLMVMSWVGLFGIPVLLVYQSWTYWVFRRRLRVEQIPEAHDVAALADRPNAR